MREAAGLLRVSERHLWNLVARGELLVARVGHAVRVPATEIERLAAPAPQIGMGAIGAATIGGDR